MIISMKEILLITFGLATATSVFGQKDSTMNQTLTLEREFTPTIRQSQKIDRQPAAISTPTRAITEQPQYAEFEPNVVTSNEIQVVPVGQVIANQDSHSLGYVEAALGNYWNADLKVGVHGENVGFDALGFFYRGTLDVPTDLPGNLTPAWEEWKSRYVNGQIVGYYTNTLANDGQLTTHLGVYGHSLEPMVQHGKVSHFGKASTDIQYEDDQWLLSVGYHYNGATLLDGTGIIFPSAFLLSGSESTEHSSQHVIDAKIRYGLYDYDPHWQAWAELALSQTFAQKNYFSLKPTLHVRYIPKKNVWRSIYAKVGIGTYREDLYDVLVATPLIAGSVNYKKSFDVFDATLGYEDNESGMFQWGGEVSVKSTVNALCGTAKLTSDNTGTQFTGTHILLSNEDNFSIGARVHADFEANQYFKAKAHFGYTSYTEDAAAFIRPRVDLGLHLQSNPGRFHLDLGIDGGLDRKMESWLPTADTSSYPSGYQKKLVDMDPLWNLTFLAEYHLLDNLKFFLIGNNLINQKQQLWPGVPAEGIDFQIGAYYVF